MSEIVCAIQASPEKILMFRRIRQRLRDMSYLKRLCVFAEQKANEAEEATPGAEHVLLSAMELPGSARRVFEKIGADSNRLPAAIKSNTLRQLLGVEPAANDESFDTVPVGSRSETASRYGHSTI